MSNEIENKSQKVGFSLADEIARSGRSNHPGRGRSGGSRGGGPRRDSDLDQKVIHSRRVTRVVAGGRRFSIAVALAVGDHRGSVGLGTGKAGDTQMAMIKALRMAKKNMFKVPLTSESSIPHEVWAKFGSAKIKIMPNGGRGLMSGSSVRDLVRLAGIKDVTTKILSGSKNRLNNARATIKALRQIKSRIPLEPKT